MPAFPLPLLLWLAFSPGAPEVQAIFERSCTTCHDAEDDVLSLEGSPDALLGRRATTGVPLVVSGDPDASYLVRKLTGHFIEGDRMPLGEDALSEGELEVVRSWIRTQAVKETSPAPVPEDPPDGSLPEDPTGEPAALGPVPPIPKEDPTGSTPAKQIERRKPFFGTHQIALQTTTTLGRNTIAYRIHHRLGKVGCCGDRNYLGLAAGGLVMSMGVEYGIVDGLDVLVRFTNAYKGWEVGAKYVPIRQENGAPISFGFFASFEGYTESKETMDNPLAGNFQTLLSRLWFERWSTMLVANYSLFTDHQRAPRIDLDDDGDFEPTRDPRGTLDVAAASTLWVGKRRRNGIDLEYIFPIPSDVFFYHGGNAHRAGTKIGAWSLGWSAKAGMHLFQLFVTNTQNVHTGLVAPGGDTENPFKRFGDFFLGFNISRGWKL